MQTSFLQWMASETATRWWHDSGDADELTQGLADGATGVTTNPVLTAQALRSCGGLWSDDLRSTLAGGASGNAKAELLTGFVVRRTAERLRSVHERTEGREGYVCAQVDPGAVGDRTTMRAMAQRFHALAPNIAVKLPATAAGLDVLEDCVAEGITVTATLSFTVPQVLAIAEAHARGAARARATGSQPGRCFSVIMIGRLDDYLRDIALDAGASAGEEDIRRAGLAVVKRAYALYRDRGYEAVLCIAALRGTYHVAELLGADLILSVHPKIQEMLRAHELPREEGIARPVDAESIARLRTLPEFIRAYEPEGLKPQEFLSYGLTQRTLSQFHETGWKQIATFTPAGPSPAAPRPA